MRRHQGVTLIELMITVIVMAILASLATPAFLDQIDRRRIVGAGDNLIADMRYAQAEAMKTNIEVDVVFTTGASWSYTMDTNPNKTTAGADYKGSSLAISAAVTSAANTITFNPKRNTISPTPASAENMVTVTSARGHSISLQVSPQSAMRLCTTSGLSGYPSCS